MLSFLSKWLPFSAGKSTALSVLAGLLGASGGSVRFKGGSTRPPRGELGIVPQKNVLFPELTCYQTLKVWKAVKDAGVDTVPAIWSPRPSLT